MEKFHDARVLCRIDVTLLEMVRPIPTSILNGKRNSFVHIRPGDISSTSSRPLDVTHILTELAGHDCEAAIE